jgi:C_GCAxxG_C_C family probable redox protein
MSDVQRAVAVFKEGYSCSQAILSTYGKRIGLKREVALKIAGGFGGGIGRMGKTCGAVTGAVMVIGLQFGMVDLADKDAKEQTYALVREFMDRFTALHGSTECKELLGCNLNTPEGFLYAKEQNLFVTICQELVQHAAELLEELIFK